MRQGHYYDPITKEARHFVPKKTGVGNRATTITDAKANNWYPGVTTVLRVLDKPALNEWKVKQGVMAVMTAPTLGNETIDDKIIRVLDVEKQDEEEAQIAADRGKDIHEAIENAINLREWDIRWREYVIPVMDMISVIGKVIATEQIVVGQGYGGKMDLLLDNDTLNTLIVTDIKTCKKLPEKGSWPEHRLQTAAYAAALGNTNDRRIMTMNIYLNTTTPGQVTHFSQDDWQNTFSEGFMPVLRYWQWMKGYYPK